MDDCAAAAAARPAACARALDAEADRILAAGPDLVGFSVLTMAEEATLGLARRIKAASPRTRVVLGGAQCLRETLAFELAADPAVDGVLLGEADHTFPRLVEALEPGQDLPVMPGLLSRRDGRVVDGGDAAPVEDLDALLVPRLRRLRDGPLPRGEPVPLHQPRLRAPMRLLHAHRPP